jgi:hypothetical protein
VGLLLAMHLGNDIPAGEAGSGLKWCPIRTAEMDAERQN